MSEYAHIRKYVTFALLGLLSLFAVYGVLLALTRSSLGVLEERAGAYEQEAAREEGRLLLEDELEEHLADRALLHGYFFTKDTIDRVIDRMEELGSDLGVRVETASIVSPKEGERDVLVTLMASGSRDALQSYLKRLEGAPIFTSIRSARLERLAETTNWELVLIVSLGGYVTP